MISSEHFHAFYDIAKFGMVLYFWQQDPHLRDGVTERMGDSTLIIYKNSVTDRTHRVHSFSTNLHS